MLRRWAAHRRSLPPPPLTSHRPSPHRPDRGALARLERAGACEALVASSRMHTSDARVAAPLMRSLAGLARLPAARAALVELGGAEAAAAALVSGATTAAATVVDEHAAAAAAAAAAAVATLCCGNDMEAWRATATADPLAALARALPTGRCCGASSPRVTLGVAPVVPPTPLQIQATHAAAMAQTHIGDAGGCEAVAALVRRLLPRDRNLFPAGTIPVATEHGGSAPPSVATAASAYGVEGLTWDICRWSLVAIGA